MNDTRTEFKVPECNLDTLKFRIAKLAKRAARLKVAPVIMTVGAFEDIKYVDKGRERIRRVFTVTVAGPAPKLNGWEFCAVLQPVASEDADLGNLLRAVPGCTLAVPVSYRAAGNNCDHCNTARRRNETFVLCNEEGLWKQVGRQCLRDFLGHQSPETYASWAEMLLDAADLAGLAEDEDGFGGSGRIAERFDAEEVLTIAAAAVRSLGWTSRKTAQEFGRSTATADVVSNWVFSNSDSRKKLDYDLTPTEEDKKVAADVTEWLKELSERDTTGNDYLYNLSLLGRGATFTTRNFGLACSAIPTHAKEKEIEIRRKKRFESDSKSQFIGAVGVRQNFEGVTVLFTTVFESQFGATSFYKMSDAAGNIIVYFSSKDMGWEQGATVSFNAAVKAHEARPEKDDPSVKVNQTVVTRAKDIPKILSAEEKKAVAKLKKGQLKLEHARRMLNYGEDSDAHNLICKVLSEIEKAMQEIKS